MKLLSIIVTYNGKAWIDRCLGSLLESSIRSDIMVIDNCSTDGTPEYICSRFPIVMLRQSQDNLGFAKANNVGLRYSLDNGYDYVFLLNQDAWLGEKDTLARLVELAGTDDNIGIISPIQLYADDELSLAFINNVSPSFISDLYSGRLRPSYEFQQVGACSWLIPRKCLSVVGGFDTVLFSHYGEDFNYCQRVRYHGMKVLTATTCTMHHDMKDRDETTYSGVKIWEDKNRDLYGKLMLGDVNSSFNVSLHTAIEVLKLLASLLSFQFSRVKAHHQEIRLMKPIRQSRRMNVKAGPTHL